MDQGKVNVLLPITNAPLTYHEYYVRQGAKLSERSQLQLAIADGEEVRCRQAPQRKRVCL